MTTHLSVVVVVDHPPPTTTSTSTSTTPATTPASRPVRPSFNSHVTSDRLREGAGLYLPPPFRTDRASNLRKGRTSVFKEMGLEACQVQIPLHRQVPQPPVSVSGCARCAGPGSDSLAGASGTTTAASSPSPSSSCLSFSSFLLFLLFFFFFPVSSATSRRSSKCVCGPLNDDGPSSHTDTCSRPLMLYSTIRSVGNSDPSDIYYFFFLVVVVVVVVLAVQDADNGVGQVRPFVAEFLQAPSVVFFVVVVVVVVVVVLFVVVVVVVVVIIVVVVVVVVVVVIPILILVVPANGQVLRVLKHKVIDIHMPVQRSRHHVAILPQAQRIPLPTRLVPVLLAVRPGRRHVAHENGLHAGLSQALQLTAQPLHVLVPGLRQPRAAVDGVVALEEEHGVEADDGEPPGDDVDGEPATAAKGLALLVGDEALPQVAVGPKPAVGPGAERVVRQEIIVAEIGHHRHRQPAIGRGKGVQELCGDGPVRFEDAGGVSRVFIITAVTGRVAGPNDKVDVILDIASYPVKGGVDEGPRRVATRLFRAVEAGRTVTAMACVAVGRV
ncbi:hypothetical protein L249_5874 [Ophiocordyceps polyrhachis-furcata BCC 54312]|uniref:Uncharacterized protein n=1 Tax=Ophiocordyceps polyrhachis-furcata BCC 54312 TaxID=1330021 RepID=A0A367L0C5_9HYPO|nr:hypothetical protein L249_5874 [Ophiocordyceps polyrhachis-furcata BCC 54312]